uniref:TolB family protein n=1 Tax=Fulvivirga sp. TaxID=1931237 RepID=UPI00404B0C6F
MKFNPKKAGRVVLITIICLILYLLVFSGRSARPETWVGQEFYENHLLIGTSGILFSSSPGNLNSGGTLDLMLYDPATGSTKLLIRGTVRGRGEYNAASSPDGKSIIFNTYRFSGWKLGIGKLENGVVNDVKKWTDRSNYEYEARYSPDGSRVAYQEFNWGTRDVDIFIADKNGRNAIHFMKSDGGDRTPHWTYDGKSIVFASGRGNSYSIYIKPVAGGEAKKLTENSSNDFAPSTSKNAAKIAYLSDAGGNLNLYVMNTDGSGKQNLTARLDAGKFTMAGYEDSGCWAMKTSWSPDGKQIVFNIPYKGDMELFIVNSDGSNLKQITDNGDTDMSPFWMY